MTTDGILRILCIEDNPVNWRLVQRLLTQAGYEMHWAEEGLKGFEMALALKPDLVLLDINLPGLSGFEVATKFRHHPDLMYTPLVALTAKTQKSDRETALVAGCDGFIPKPIDPFTFVKQVGDYLGGQRERIEQAREGAALRQFNVQVLEHLEIQLREAQEANKKLLEAQDALEQRNRSLSRLIALSQSILTEHDPRALLARILGEARLEVQAGSVHAYRHHPEGAYWEGLRWNGEAFEEAPVLALDHAFCRRARMLLGHPALHGGTLKGSRIHEEGIALGLWAPSAEASLLVLKDRQDEADLWGFWTFAREGGRPPFRPEDVEMMTLHASIFMVTIENAELIESLNHSSRALASSYERIECAYQDLQRAKADLSMRDRQVLLEDLFFKIAQRLEAPVATLHVQSQVLDQLMVGAVPGDPQGLQEGHPRALAEIREAVSKIDGLLKALLRRVGKEGPASPEWVDLHDLIQQELELLQAEGAIPVDVKVETRLGAEVPTLYAVYGDFSKALLHLVLHAMGGPTPSAILGLSTWRVGDTFHLEIRDEGGVIPPTGLEAAFEPFSGLHQQPVMGIRYPGDGLPICRQLLAAYHGETFISNQGEGTAVEVRFPLK